MRKIILVALCLVGFFHVACPGDYVKTISVTYTGFSDNHYETVVIDDSGVVEIYTWVKVGSKVDVIHNWKARLTPSEIDFLMNSVNKVSRLDYTPGDYCPEAVKTYVEMTLSSGKVMTYTIPKCPSVPSDVIVLIDWIDTIDEIYMVDMYLDEVVDEELFPIVDVWLELLF